MDATASKPEPMARLLTPEFQEEFWSGLDPDLRAFCEQWEAAEPWTWDYLDLPSLFDELSALLPDVLNLPFHKTSDRTLLSLIELMGTLPLRYAVSAISLMDAQAEMIGGNGPSWGAACFAVSRQIVENEPEHEAFLWARVFYERIQVMVKARLAHALFSDTLLRRSPK